LSDEIGARHFSPSFDFPTTFCVLVVHRIDDVDERLIAIERWRPVRRYPSSQRLERGLAEHFDDATHLSSARRQLSASLADHCLRSEEYVNVIVSDKQPDPVYVDMHAPIVHCAKDIGIWEWPSNHEGAEPDGVVASAGHILTQEALAAVAMLRQNLPDLKIHFVNVVDRYALQRATEHPHGLSDRAFDSLFTKTTGELQLP
jgi:XFP C-terminal domain